MRVMRAGAGFALVALLALVAEGDVSGVANSRAVGGAEVGAAAQTSSARGFRYSQWLQDKDAYSTPALLTDTAPSALSKPGSFWGDVAGRLRSGAVDRARDSLVNAAYRGESLAELMLRHHNGGEFDMREWLEINRRQVGDRIGAILPAFYRDAEGVLAGALSEAAAELGFVERARISFETALGGRKATGGVEAAGALAQRESYVVGWQLRAFAGEDSAKGLNSGLFYRRVVNDLGFFDDSLAGVNLFLDFEDGDLGDFWRWSIGGDLKSYLGEISANRYFAITDAQKDARGNDVYTREGFDFDFALNIPRVEWAKARVGYYNFEGEFGDEDDSGLRAGLDLHPGHGLVVGLQYDDNGGEFGGNISYTHKFGEASAGASRPAEFDPRAHFFDTVRREYSQRITRAGSGNNNVVLVSSNVNVRVRNLIVGGNTITATTIAPTANINFSFPLAVSSAVTIDTMGNGTLAMRRGNNRWFLTLFDNTEIALRVNTVAANSVTLFVNRGSGILDRNNGMSVVEFNNGDLLTLIGTRLHFNANRQVTLYEGGLVVPTGFNVVAGDRTTVRVGNISATVADCRNPGDVTFRCEVFGASVFNIANVSVTQGRGDPESLGSITLAAGTHDDISVNFDQGAGFGYATVTTAQATIFNIFVTPQDLGENTRANQNVQATVLGIDGLHTPRVFTFAAGVSVVPPVVISPVGNVRSAIATLEAHTRIGQFTIRGGDGTYPQPYQANGSGVSGAEVSIDADGILRVSAPAATGNFRIEITRDDGDTRYNRPATLILTVGIFYALNLRFEGAAASSPVAVTTGNGVNAAGDIGAVVAQTPFGLSQLRVVEGHSFVQLTRNNERGALRYIGNTTNPTPNARVVIEARDGNTNSALAVARISLTLNIQDPPGVQLNIVGSPRLTRGTVNAPITAATLAASGGFALDNVEPTARLLTNPQNAFTFQNNVLVLRAPNTAGRTLAAVIVAEDAHRGATPATLTVSVAVSPLELRAGADFVAVKVPRTAADGRLNLFTVQAVGGAGAQVLGAVGAPFVFANPDAEGAREVYLPAGTYAANLGDDPVSVWSFAVRQFGGEPLQRLVTVAWVRELGLGDVPQQLVNTLSVNTQRFVANIDIAGGAGAIGGAAGTNNIRLLNEVEGWSYQVGNARSGGGFVRVNHSTPGVKQARLTFAVDDTFNGAPVPQTPPFTFAITLQVTVFADLTLDAANVTVMAGALNFRSTKVVRGGVAPYRIQWRGRDEADENDADVTAPGYFHPDDFIYMRADGVIEVRGASGNPSRTGAQAQLITVTDSATPTPNVVTAQITIHYVDNVPDLGMNLVPAVTVHRVGEEFKAADIEFTGGAQVAGAGDFAGVSINFTGGPMALTSDIVLTRRVTSRVDGASVQMVTTASRALAAVGNELRSFGGAAGIVTAQVIGSNFKTSITQLITVEFVAPLAITYPSIDIVRTVIVDANAPATPPGLSRDNPRGTLANLILSVITVAAALGDGANVQMQVGNIPNPLMTLAASGGGGAYTFEAGGAFSVNGAMVSFTPTEPGVHTGTLIAINTYQEFEQRVTSVMNIEVEAVPVLPGAPVTSTSGVIVSAHVLEHVEVSGFDVVLSSYGKLLATVSAGGARQRYVAPNGFPLQTALGDNRFVVVTSNVPSSDSTWYPSFSVGATVRREDITGTRVTLDILETNRDSVGAATRTEYRYIRVQFAQELPYPRSRPASAGNVTIGALTIFGGNGTYSVSFVPANSGFAYDADSGELTHNPATAPAAGDVINAMVIADDDTNATPGTLNVRLRAGELLLTSTGEPVFYLIDGQNNRGHRVFSITAVGGLSPYKFEGIAAAVPFAAVHASEGVNARTLQLYNGVISDSFQSTTDPERLNLANARTFVVSDAAGATVSMLASVYFVKPIRAQVRGGYGVLLKGGSTPALAAEIEMANDGTGRYTYEVMSDYPAGYFTMQGSLLMGQIPASDTRPLFIVTVRVDDRYGESSVAVDATPPLHLKVSVYANNPLLAPAATVTVYTRAIGLGEGVFVRPSGGYGPYQLANVSPDTGGNIGSGGLLSINTDTTVFGDLRVNYVSAATTQASEGVVPAGEVAIIDGGRIVTSDTDNNMNIPLITQTTTIPVYIRYMNPPQMSIAATNIVQTAGVAFTANVRVLGGIIGNKSISVVGISGGTILSPALTLTTQNHEGFRTTVTTRFMPQIRGNDVQVVLRGDTEGELLLTVRVADAHPAVADVDVVVRARIVGALGLEVLPFELPSANQLFTVSLHVRGGDGRVVNYVSNPGGNGSYVRYDFVDEAVVLRAGSAGSDMRIVVQVSDETPAMPIRRTIEAQVLGVFHFTNQRSAPITVTTSSPGITIQLPRLQFAAVGRAGTPSYDIPEISVTNRVINPGAGEENLVTFAVSARYSLSNSGVLSYIGAFPPFFPTDDQVILRASVNTQEALGTITVRYVYPPAVEVAFANPRQTLRFNQGGEINIGNISIGGGWAPTRQLHLVGASDFRLVTTGGNVALRLGGDNSRARVAQVVVRGTDGHHGSYDGFMTARVTVNNMPVMLSIVSGNLRHGVGGASVVFVTISLSGGLDKAYSVRATPADVEVLRAQDAVQVSYITVEVQTGMLEGRTVFTYQRQRVVTPVSALFYARIGAQSERTVPVRFTGMDGTSAPDGVLDVAVTIKDPEGAIGFAPAGNFTTPAGRGAFTVGTVTTGGDFGTREARIVNESENQHFALRVTGGVTVVVMPYPVSTGSYVASLFAVQTDATFGGRTVATLPLTVQVAVPTPVLSGPGAVAITSIAADYLVGDNLNVATITFSGGAPGRAVEVEGSIHRNEPTKPPFLNWSVSGNEMIFRITNYGVPFANQPKPSLAEYMAQVAAQPIAERAYKLTLFYGDRNASRDRFAFLTLTVGVLPLQAAIQAAIQQIITGVGICPLNTPCTPEPRTATVYAPAPPVLTAGINAAMTILAESAESTGPFSFQKVGDDAQWNVSDSGVINANFTSATVNVVTVRIADTSRSGRMINAVFTLVSAPGPVMVTAQQLANALTLQRVPTLTTGVPNLSGGQEVTVHYGFHAPHNAVGVINFNDGNRTVDVVAAVLNNVIQNPGAQAVNEAGFATVYLDPIAHTMLGMVSVTVITYDESRPESGTVETAFTVDLRAELRMTAFDDGVAFTYRGDEIFHSYRGNFNVVRGGSQEATPRDLAALAVERTRDGNLVNELPVLLEVTGGNGNVTYENPGNGFTWNGGILRYADNTFGALHTAAVTITNVNEVPGDGSTTIEISVYYTPRAFVTLTARSGNDYISRIATVHFRARPGAEGPPATTPPTPTPPVTVSYDYNEILVTAPRQFFGAGESDVAVATVNVASGVTPATDSRGFRISTAEASPQAMTVTTRVDFAYAIAANIAGGAFNGSLRSQSSLVITATPGVPVTVTRNIGSQLQAAGTRNADVIHTDNETDYPLTRTDVQIPNGAATYTLFPYPALAGGGNTHLLLFTDAAAASGAHYATVTADDTDNATAPGTVYATLTLAPHPRPVTATVTVVQGSQTRGIVGTLSAQGGTPPYGFIPQGVSLINAEVQPVGPSLLRAVGIKSDGEIHLLANPNLQTPGLFTLANIEISDNTPAPYNTRKATAQMLLLSVAPPPPSLQITVSYSTPEVMVTTRITRFAASVTNVTDAHNYTTANGNVVNVPASSTTVSIGASTTTISRATRGPVVVAAFGNGNAHITVLGFSPPELQLGYDLPRALTARLNTRALARITVALTASNGGSATRVLSLQMNAAAPQIAAYLLSSELTVAIGASGVGTVDAANVELMGVAVSDNSYQFSVEAVTSGATPGYDFSNTRLQVITVNNNRRLRVESIPGSARFRYRIHVWHNGFAMNTPGQSGTTDALPLVIAQPTTPLTARVQILNAAATDIAGVVTVQFGSTSANEILRIVPSGGTGPYVSELQYRGSWYSDSSDTGFRWNRGLGWLTFRSNAFTKSGTGSDRTFPIRVRDANGTEIRFTVRLDWN